MLTMKTDYALHEGAYQKKRADPDYAGWIRQDELADDWQQTWQPLMQQPAFPKQGRLLELGCGAGNVSVAFAQVGYRVTGVDIAPTAIQWAEENAAVAQVEAQFVQGDVLTLADFADAAFDIVLDGRCLHCIIGADRDRFLQSAYRVLKPNGVLTVCSMCNEIPDLASFRNFDPQSRCVFSGDIATRYIGDSNDILREIMAIGFRLIHVELVPRRHAEDLAELRAIAAKPG